MIYLKDDKGNVYPAKNAKLWAKKQGETPVSQGDSSAQVSGITTGLYQHLNTFYVRDDTVDYTTPGVPNTQNWYDFQMNVQTYGVIKIIDDLWTLCAGTTPFATSNILATEGWPWDVTTWTPVSTSDKVFVTEKKETYNRNDVIEISGISNPAQMNGTYLPWPKGYTPTYDYLQLWRQEENKEVYITTTNTHSQWIIAPSYFSTVVANSYCYCSRSTSRPFDRTTGASLTWTNNSGTTGTCNAINYSDGSMVTVYGAGLEVINGKYPIVDPTATGTNRVWRKTVGDVTYSLDFVTPYFRLVDSDGTIYYRGNFGASNPWSDQVTWSAVSTADNPAPTVTWGDYTPPVYNAPTKIKVAGAGEPEVDGEYLPTMIADQNKPTIGDIFTNTTNSCAFVFDALAPAGWKLKNSSGITAYATSGSNTDRWPGDDGVVFQVYQGGTSPVPAITNQRSGPIDVWEWCQLKPQDKMQWNGKWYEVDDAPTVDVFNKTYNTTRLGLGEIGYLTTNANLDVGLSGIYYNNDSTLGEIYGSMFGWDVATLLDYKLKQERYNPKLQGSFNWSTFVRIMQLISTNPFTFEIGFNSFDNNEPYVIFGEPDVSGVPMLYIGILSKGNYQFSRRTTEATGWAHLTIPYSSGDHVFKVERTAEASIFYFDNVSQTSVSGTPLDMNLSSLCRSNFSGNINFIKVSINGTEVFNLDLTPNKTPSNWRFHKGPANVFSYLTGYFNVPGGNTSNYSGVYLKSSTGWQTPPYNNFSLFPVRWNDYEAIINEGDTYDLTHNYALNVNFTFTEAPTTVSSIFGTAILQQSGPATLRTESTFKVRAASNQYWRSDEQQFASVLLNKELAVQGFEAKVTTQPNTVTGQILTSGFEITASDSMSTAVATVKVPTTDIRSDFPGYITSLNVVDTTTNTIVYAAPKEMLQHYDWVGNDFFNMFITPNGRYNITQKSFAHLNQYSYNGSIDFSNGVQVLSAVYSTTNTTANKAYNTLTGWRPFKALGTVTIDNIDYNTVTIGLQTFTKENDKNARFSRSRSDSALNEIYGRIYNYYGAKNYDYWLKWHKYNYRVPRADELQELVNFIDATHAPELKDLDSWQDVISDYPVNNLTDFSALASGTSITGANVGSHFFIWTLTWDDTNTYVKRLWMRNNVNSINIDNQAPTNSSCVRLIKRFYEVPIPHLKMVRRFVKVGKLFIDTENFIYPAQDHRIFSTSNYTWVNFNTNMANWLAAGRILKWTVKGKTLGFPDSGFLTICSNAGQYGCWIRYNKQLCASVSINGTRTDFEPVNTDVNEDFSVEIYFYSNSCSCVFNNDKANQKTLQGRGGVTNIAPNSTFNGYITENTVEDIETGEILFRAPENVIYNDAMGKSYNGDPLFDLIYGRYYNVNEMETIINGFMQKKIPLTAFTNEQWSVLMSYNNNTRLTIGKYVSDPDTFISPPDTLTNLFETSFPASGFILNNASSTGQGERVMFMTNTGLLGNNAGTPEEMSSYYNINTLKTTYPSLAAPIRLVYGTLPTTNPNYV